MRQLGLKIVVLKLLAVWSLFILTARAETPRFQQLGHTSLTPGSTLAFGVSANPATLEHMGILARLMTRFAFTEARLMPTMPYKVSGGSPEQIVDISRVAVTHFDEVLDSNGIPFEVQPTAEHSPSFAWNDSGHRFELKLDTYDIDQKNIANTLNTLDHLVAEKNGDAKKVFWVSGGDSFASVPTWMPNWKDMFDRANWVVISRPGFTENGVDFHSNDPLRKVYDAAFLDQYTYSFDPENQVHNYINIDSSKPNIYIVSQPVLNYSSSVARDSFAANDHHHIAQAGLQPSVFRHCLQNGYYSSEADADYRAFTEQNLGIYLRHILAKLESQTGTSRKAWQDEYQNLSKKLVAILMEESRKPARSNKNWRDTLLSFINEAAEVLHTIQHPNGSQNIPLIGGDATLQRSLNNLRNQLLRGDPNQIFSRTMEFGLGLEGEPIEMNLIRSRMPSWVPLWIRQRDNRNVTWHDLNVSTNEMVALLRNPKLAAAIKKVAGQDAAVHTALLRQAIQNSSRALTRFRVFAASRYFKRIATGAVSHEILEGFSPLERSAIEELQKQHLGIEEKLSPLEREHYTEALAQIYALKRVLDLEPKKIHDVTFWHHYRDLLATGYPGLLYNANQTKQREKLNVLIPLIEMGLNILLKDGVRTQAIKNLDGILPSHSRESTTLRELSRRRLTFAIDRHIELNARLFSDSRAQSTAENKSFDLLPINTIGDGVPRGNLIWDIKKLSVQMQREFATLEGAFEGALNRLRTQPTHAKSEAIFMDAREMLLATRERQLQEFRIFEYAVLRAKSLRPFEKESSLPGYEIFVNHLKLASQELSQTNKQLRTLTQIMLGSIGHHLAEPYRLRADVGAVLGLTADEDLLRLGAEHRAAVPAKLYALRAAHTCSTLVARLPR